MSYGTYFGGSAETSITALAADSAGDVYVTGWSRAADLPVTQGAYQTKSPGCTTGAFCTHAFVAKIGHDGKLVWSTYLGGTTYDTGAGIAVDAAGSVYVAGNTLSGDFPTTPDALAQPTGKSGGFVAKLDATGSKLVYSTFLPIGGVSQSVNALALGPQGTLVVAGKTNAADFPTANALQPQFPGGSCGSKYGPSLCYHAFFAGWRSSDMKPLFASYLGGTGVDVARGAAVDAAGDIYLTGSTNSPDFPLRNALQQTAGAGNCPDTVVNHYPSVCSDAFLTKLSPDGRTLLYSTRLGGAFGESGNAIAIDAAGDAIVVGTTASSDFPVVHAAESYPGTGVCGSSDLAGRPVPCPHAFAAKLKPDGSSLIYSTYISGKGGDDVTAAAIDGAGNLYVGGYTTSNGFPVTGGALRHCNAHPNSGAWLGNDGTDGVEGTNGLAGAGFVAELDAGGALAFATYFGGTGYDQVFGLAPDGDSAIYVAGSTASPDLPATADAIQPQSPDYTPPANGNPAIGESGFLARLSFTAPASPAPQIDTGCVVNAAGFQAGAIAPGEIVSLFGSGLGPATGAGAMLDAQGHIATNLAGTTVTFDGIPAPLLYAGANQVNAIVPFEIAGKSATQIVATVNGVASTAQQQAVVAATPGVFTLDLTGAGPAVILNQDGTVNSATHPAARGSVVTLWITGMGALGQSYADGEVVTGNLGAVTHNLGINLITPGSFPLTILYAGQAPQMAAGVVQVNARIPPDMFAGLSQTSFILHVDGLTGNAPFDTVFANGVTIWTQ